MLDIRFVREHPDEVKENIKKKFQDAKLPLVDEVINLDAEYRAAIGEGDTLRANRNKLSKQIGMLMGQAKKDPSKAAEAEEIKKQVTAQADRLKELETKEAELQDKIRDIMYTIPQMIDPSVPIGPDDSCNVEVQRFGDPVVPDYPIPYHVDIMESFDGIDLDAAGRVSGNGFYYLLGDIARLHEAVLAYARDFMIDKGFTYVIPPFMMHGDVVKGVMSFPEMDAMMYKIEGEDLYLIGTSEHTMIGRFIDQTLDGAKLPPAVVGASIEMFKMLGESDALHDKLVKNVEHFRKGMMAAGFDIKPTQSAICAVMLYDAKLSQDFAARLQDEGIFVTGFYYPVVPKGQARIRVQVSAGHTTEQLDRCIAAFVKIGKEMNVIK